MNRRGFSAVEVLISVAILAVAFVPIVTMMSSGTRQGAYSEYHLMAQARAETIVQLLLSRDLQALATLPTGAPSPLPPELVRLDLELPEEYRERWSRFFEETVTWTPIEPGLAKVQVRIDWTMPSEPRGASHRFTLTRLIGAPDEGLIASHVPRQEPAR